jgi:UDP-N-acetylmuramoyl-tripeptide--D-alanyl-D-alanine ligase
MNVPSLYALYLEAGGKVCTDSRKIEPGCLFFALKGPSFDGNRFAHEALKQGAAYAVVDDANLPEGNHLVRVPDALTALQALARHHRRQLSGTKVIALTGSNGKTTTKELMHAVLSEKFRTAATQGNLNNHIGVPLTLLGIRPGCEMAVVEMGATHVGEIAQLCAIAEPEFGLITNIGKAHLEGFGGMEGVKKGKGELYDWLKGGGHTVFVRRDDAELTAMLGPYEKAVYYGPGAGCLVGGRAEAEGPFVKLVWTSDKRPGATYSALSNLTGLYNASNLLAAVCVGTYFGVGETDIRSAIENYAPSNQRSQFIVQNGNALILDYYNANPGSMEAALRNFSETDPGNEFPRRLLILGDMLELGEASAREHQAVAEQAGATGAECVFVGKEFAACKLPAGALSFATSAEAAAHFRQKKPTGCFVLVKGSRGIRLEDVVHVLKG